MAKNYAKFFNTYIHVVGNPINTFPFMIDIYAHILYMRWFYDKITVKKPIFVYSKLHLA